MFNFMNPTYQRPAEKFIKYVGDNTPSNREPIMLGRIAEVVGFEGDLDEQSRRGWSLVVEPLKGNRFVEVGDPINTKDFVDGKDRFCSSVELTGKGWKAYRKIRSRREDRLIESASRVTHLQNDGIQQAIESASRVTHLQNDGIQQAIESASRVAHLQNDGIQQAIESASRVAHLQNDGIQQAIERASRVAHLQNDGIQQAIERASRNLASAPIRSVASAIAELNRIPQVQLPSPSIAFLRQAQNLEEQFRESFKLPEEIVTRQLLAEFQKNPLAGVISRYSENTDSVGSFIQSMTTPWLDAVNRITSVKGLAQLKGISTILDRMPSYSDQVSNALRVDLGDWRDRMTFSGRSLENLTDRVEFYESLGFDPSLTSFPPEAFQEALTKSGLRLEPPPPRIKEYVLRLPPSKPEVDTAFKRTNQAHLVLLSLETHLRCFIDEEMSREFGPDWPRKNKMPKGLYEKWADKKQNAEEHNRSSSLISYADFTDYELVICKKENWNKVFSKFFSRLESIRESLQRLYPIRLDTMHARPITQDDELILFVEARRVFNTIRLSKS